VTDDARMQSRLFLVAVVLCGCATADKANDRSVTLVDAGQQPDPTPPKDAPDHTNPPPGVDAAPAGCTTQMTDLLANGAFDATPKGTGWQTKPIDMNYPIVDSTMPTGYTPATSPNIAWLGGFAQAGANDEMYQDVHVPAGTTQLQLTGSYMVLTAETGTTAKDKATVELRTTAGTKIESVLALDNRSTATSWTPLDHTFATASAGQTVRLYFSSTNNTTNVTDFFYDSLQLVATHCD